MNSSNPTEEDLEIINIQKKLSQLEEQATEFASEVQENCSVDKSTVNVDEKETEEKQSLNTYPKNKGSIDQTIQSNSNKQVFCRKFSYRCHSRRFKTIFFSLWRISSNNYFSGPKYRCFSWICLLRVY